MTGPMAPEYRAAMEGVGLIDRPDRAFRLLVGRAPTRMLTGMVTGSMPPDPQMGESGVLLGAMPCSAMLTPKGRIVTELRVGRIEGGEEGALLLDFPVPGFPGALAHMTRYLPPRFARVEEPQEPLGLITVVGPHAPTLLADELLAGRVTSTYLETLAEGDQFAFEEGAWAGVRFVRNHEVGPPAFDLVAERGVLADFTDALSSFGVTRSNAATYELLRIEHGRPAFGIDMDENTLPPEAGIDRRCIDHRKGCYTGQEVIVRIRDRGHVNRRLCGLLLGEIPLPVQGTPLFHPDRDSPVGETRSAAFSPLFGQGIALAYVRREVTPPAAIFLGRPTGQEVEVRELADTGWVLVGGESTTYP